MAQMGQASQANQMRVFVSHSSEDNDLGHRLVADLRQALGGEDAVWYDSSGGLYGGDDWWGKIVAELTARPVFLVVLSPAAMESKWVQDEINLAWRQKNSRQGKLLVPVLYRPCVVREDLRNLQMVSFVAPRPYAEAFDALVAALNRGGAAMQPIVESVPELLARTSELMRQKRPAEAVPVGERATHLDPQSVAAWSALAAAYYGSSRFADALAAVERALRLDASSSSGWDLKGVTLIALGRDQEALTAIERALALDPRSAKAWCNKAVVLFRQERDHDALQASEQALRLDPRLGPAWRIKANALRALGREGEATEAQRHADQLGG